MAIRKLKGNDLINTRVGCYVWYESLQLVDLVEKGKRTPEHTIHLRLSQNTELGAMIAATKHMLKLLNEVKRKATQ